MSTRRLTLPMSFSAAPLSFARRPLPPLPTTGVSDADCATFCLFDLRSTTASTCVFSWSPSSSPLPLSLSASSASPSPSLTPASSRWPSETVRGFLALEVRQATRVKDMYYETYGAILAREPLLPAIDGLSLTPDTERLGDAALLRFEAWVWLEARSFGTVAFFVVVGEDGVSDTVLLRRCCSNVGDVISEAGRSSLARGGGNDMDPEGFAGSSFAAMGIWRSDATLSVTEEVPRSSEASTLSTVPGCELPPVLSDGTSCSTSAKTLRMRHRSNRYVWRKLTFHVLHRPFPKLFLELASYAVFPNEVLRSRKFLSADIQTWNGISKGYWYDNETHTSWIRHLQMW